MPARVALASFHPLIFAFKYVCPQKKCGKKFKRKRELFLLLH